MSKIVVVTTGKGNLAWLAAGVRQVVAISLEELRRRVQPDSVLAEFILFGDDHHEVARKLRLIIAALERAGVTFRLYELGEKESFEELGQPERFEVSPARVESILQRHEAEWERQRHLGREESQLPELSLDEGSDWFWEIIQGAQRDCKKLRAILWELNEGELVRFYKEFARVASVFEGEPFDGILSEERVASEDTIMDVAYWVVAQGREYCERILKEPRLIPRRVASADPAVMYHVAVEVFDAKFDKEIEYE